MTVQFPALLNITSCFGGMGSVKKYRYILKMKALSYLN